MCHLSFSNLVKHAFPFCFPVKIMEWSLIRDNTEDVNILYMYTVHCSRFIKMRDLLLALSFMCAIMFYLCLSFILLVVSSESYHVLSCIFNIIEYSVKCRLGRSLLEQQ